MDVYRCQMPMHQVLACIVRIHQSVLSVVATSSAQSALSHSVRPQSVPASISPKNRHHPRQTAQSKPHIASTLACNQNGPTPDDRIMISLLCYVGYCPVRHVYVDGRHPSSEFGGGCAVGLDHPVHTLITPYSTANVRSPYSACTVILTTPYTLMQCTAIGGPSTRISKKQIRSTCIYVVRCCSSYLLFVTSCKCT